MAKSKATTFKLRADQIRPIVPDLGACIASHRITVDGARVGSMVRESSTRAGDTGWCFFAGDESQRYMDDPDNFSIHAVNTVANYDLDIVPYLFALPGQRFDRDRDRGAFVEAPDSAPDPQAAGLPPEIRVVQGPHRLGRRAWSIELPVPFRRRVEDGSVVLWRVGLTFWINVFGPGDQPTAARVAALRAHVAPDATDLQIVERAGLLQIAYRLRDDATPDQPPPLHAFVVGDAGHVQLAVYLDREDDLDAARAAIASCAP